MIKVAYQDFREIYGGKSGVQDDYGNKNLALIGPSTFNNERQ